MEVESKIVEGFTSESKYRKVGAMLLVALIVVGIGAPIALYINLEKMYGADVAPHIFGAILCEAILVLFYAGIVIVLFREATKEKLYKDRIVLMCIVIGVALFIAALLFILTDANLKYIGYATAKVVVNITNATLYIQPARGSELNVTLVFTVHNNNTFPINVTRVYVDIGDVCTGIGLLFIMPVPYSTRCYTELNLPSSGIVIEPNSTTTIAAQRIYSKAVSAKSYAPIIMEVRRADITYPPSAKSLTWRATALARIAPNSE